MIHSGRNTPELHKAFTPLSLKRRRALDHAARGIITGGGIAVIGSIVAILLFILIEVAPLMRGASAEQGFSLSESRIPDKSSAIVAAGVDGFREIGYLVRDEGSTIFFTLDKGEMIQTYRLQGVKGSKITSAHPGLDSRTLTLGLADGSAIEIRIAFDQSYSHEGERLLTPVVEESPPLKIAAEGLTAVNFHFTDGESSAAAALTVTGRLIFSSREVEESLFGKEEVNEHTYELTEDMGKDHPTALALDPFGRNLYVGSREGKIYHWNVRPATKPVLADVLKAGAAVNVLEFLAAGRSLIVGQEDGGLSVWFLVESGQAAAGKRLTKVHTLPPHRAPVTALAVTGRNRGFLSADAGGRIGLNHATSQRRLLSLDGGKAPVTVLAFAPKANGIVAANDKGMVREWKLDNPHPETTLHTLFGKVWYEGYSEPEYVWQSTGLEDDFEPKLSLTPLAFGTFKGTFYALLIAVPVAILGALCVSQFMHPRLGDVIKPTIEVMAALPSVILGFLAGLWLAPYVQKSVPAIFIMPVVLLGLTMVALLLWRALPLKMRGRFRGGTELVLFLAPLYIFGIWLSLALGQPLERLFLEGDFGSWLYSALGMTYDQRNSLIVGFAMGFAVIPIIFSISEDALSNVPRHLISGSLALGATRWQTALGVVIPTASPGIFSAVMIGLGRAVGETMIVLMATGNTPIMDWSIFNGFRALSANIAVEIPEAPHGGTLYRVLFLAALLLFAITFLVNTAAEVVRVRLRKRYGRL